MKKSILSLGIIMSTQFAVAGGNNEVVTAPDAKLDESLVDSTLSLQELVVNAHFANVNKTPLNLTTITPAEIRMHIAAPNYLEMFQGIPGVYATASTGSYGDATLNMRGFKQDNIAILLNGIPIQGLTSGSMYWSNWMGLADATHSVQLQKGLGSSMMVDCAMGGLVNIVTKTADSVQKTEFGLSTTQWGTTKGTLSYSSGLLNHGWSINANLAYVTGKGYVQCTDVETMSYMLSVSKILNKTNTLIFTALGSPEKHDQRNTELTSEEVNKYGRDYSKNWGYLNGKATSIGHNHYFKPYFTLQHIMDGERLSMKNSIYLAIADGGGTSTLSAGKNTIIGHQTKDGHIDFDAVIAENQMAKDAEGKYNGQHALIDYLSGHTQLGTVVSADYKLTDNWNIAGGVQYQYYDTWSKMVMMDMLGADYLTYYGKKYYFGDYVGSRYGRTTHHASGFAQGTYTADNIVANLGISVFSGHYRRHNDETGEKSDWAHGMGASVKGGIIWRLCKSHSIYLNAGYNSRLPYAGVYLASSDLKITNDITNETNLMAEMGWRHQWNGGGLELSGYLASWRNKTLTVSLAKRADAAAEKYQIKGLNALHMGLEFNAHQQITSWLKATAYAMTASWKWKNSGNAIIYDTYNNDVLKEYSISCDGLHVGDAPQTQLGATLEAKLNAGFYIHAGWQYNARMYADFEPSSRTSADKADAYKLPSYSLIDATIGWEKAIGINTRLNVFATGTNLLDSHYIERGVDGTTHDINSFKGYWGQARTVSVGFRIVGL